MAVLVAILIKAVFGAICASIASNRGRNPVAWFFIGFFFDCIAIVVVLVIGDLKQQQLFEQKLKDENRMLREQIRNNRMVMDERHGETERRLQVHDRALGVDTTRPPALGPGAAPPAGQAALAFDPPPAGFADAKWHYSRNDRAEGPVAFAQLKALAVAGEVTDGTLVWTEGMANWAALDQIAGLADALRA